MINKQAYSEVYAIINLMSDELKNKISKDVLKNIDRKRDKSHLVVIDDIEDFKPSEQANKLLAVLYKSFFATYEEKRVIQAKEKTARL